MAGTSLEEVKMESEEEHKVAIKEEISPVEEMCAIYIKDEDIKMENTEIQGYLVLILLTYIM